MSETKPALTPEEWATPENEWLIEQCASGKVRRHAMAARCLHGQPFGFTWDGVEELRGAAAYIRRAASGESDAYALYRDPASDDPDEIIEGPSGYELADALERHANRIAVLLPPSGQVEHAQGRTP